MPPRWVATALLALTACGGDPLEPPLGSLVRVTGASPFAADCNGPVQRGTNYRGAEVEPFVAVDPADPMHVVGVWQQDRWSNGGANGLGAAASFDGGKTWTVSYPRFSRCAGGDATNGGGYARTSDPWVTIAPDGSAYEISISFEGPRSSVLASRSADGGRTWSDPATLLLDTDDDVFNDKESITADPVDGHHVYAVWDRVTGLTTPTQPVGTGAAWLARATDGVWAPARPIYDPGVDNQTIGNVLTVLPDGTLIDVFELILNISSNQSPSSIGVIRSVDHGETWSQPITVAAMSRVGTRDGDGVFVRSGGLPTIAADPDSGAVYVAWEDASPSQGERDAIVMSTSHDGGLTWSQPVPVSQDPAHAAFTPMLAAVSGTLALGYFDTRADDPADRSTFLATAWLARSGDGGATWSETALGPPFDLKLAKLGDAYFLGDYQGLAGTPSGEFVPFFVMADAGASGPTDVFVLPTSL